MLSNFQSFFTCPTAVLDVNDNTPIFVTANQNCEILENSPANAHVCVSRATDRDIGENARIVYTIAGGDNKFAVSAVSSLFY